MQQNIITNSREWIRKTEWRYCDCGNIIKYPEMDVCEECR